MDIIKVTSKSVEKKLQVFMPKNCNYSCSYCFQDKNSKALNPVFFTKNKMDQINKVIDKFGITFLTLIGGEPTLFDLYPLITGVHPMVNKILLISNFSLNDDYFIQLNECAKQNNIELRLFCSLHDEFADYREFIDKLNRVHKSGVSYMALEYVVCLSNMKSCMEVIDYFKRNLHQDIYYVVDYDYTTDIAKQFYEQHKLYNCVNHRNHYNIEIDNGDKFIVSRQKLRFVKLPVEKYCITDLTLRENNSLYSCYRKIAPNIDGISEDVFANSCDFKCGNEYCRFCHDPHISTDQEDFVVNELSNWIPKHANY